MKKMFSVLVLLGLLSSPAFAANDAVNCSNEGLDAAVKALVSSVAKNQTDAAKLYVNYYGMVINNERTYAEAKKALETLCAVLWLSTVQVGD